MENKPGIFTTVISDKKKFFLAILLLNINFNSVKSVTLLMWALFDLSR